MVKVHKTPRPERSKPGGDVRAGASQKVDESHYHWR